MNKQLPPTSKMAGVNMLSSACMGLCTSPITMASTISCLFPLLSALLWAHRAHTSPSSGLFNLHLPVSHSPCFPLHKVCVPDLVCLPCALYPWTHSLRIIWTVHLGAVLRICGLYSTCLACMECLPGSALKAVACCCWFFQFPRDVLLL